MCCARLCSGADYGKGTAEPRAVGIVGVGFRGLGGGISQRLQPGGAIHMNRKPGFLGGFLYAVGIRQGYGDKAQLLPIGVNHSLFG